MCWLDAVRWSRKGIQALPRTNIGDLTIDGDFDLSGNELQLLPESFGGLTVGGQPHCRWRGHLYSNSPDGNEDLSG